MVLEAVERTVGAMASVWQSVIESIWYITAFKLMCPSYVAKELQICLNLHSLTLWGRGRVKVSGPLPPDTSELVGLLQCAMNGVSFSTCCEVKYS